MVNIIDQKTSKANLKRKKMQTREAFIFCKMQKAIMEMRDKKATGDDDVPGDVPKLLGEDGHSIETQLINNIYERGEWPMLSLKLLDRINRTKLIQIIKVTGIDWCERRLISKLYVDQSIKLKLDQGGDKKRETGGGIRQVCCLLLILFIFFRNTILRKLLNTSETSKQKDK
jgi:hypothetical protein